MQTVVKKKSNQFINFIKLTKRLNQQASLVQFILLLFSNQQQHRFNSIHFFVINISWLIIVSHTIILHCRIANWIDREEYEWIVARDHCVFELNTSVLQRSRLLLEYLILFIVRWWFLLVNRVLIIIQLVN